MNPNYEFIPRSDSSGLYYYPPEECLYHKYFSREIAYLKCIEPNCDCRGRIVNGIFERTNAEVAHNHPINKEKIGHKRAYANIRETIKAGNNEVRKVHQAVVKTVPREVARNLDWSHVKSNLNRTRRNQLPSCRSLKELEGYLEDETSYAFQKYGLLRDTRFYQGSINDHLVFANLTLISELPEALNIYVDATFSVTPFKARQLLVILADLANKPRPIVFCIMNRKQTNDYKAIFSFLREAVFCHDGIDRIPQRATSDFELAIRKALLDVWSEITIVGCNFHWCQSLYRNAGSEITGDARNNFILVLFMRLSLLPLERVMIGFDALENFITEQSLDDIFDTFIAYFKDTWLGDKYPLKTWNVSEFDRRTNNNLEGFNNKIKNTIPLQPTPWVFLESLNSLALEAITSFDYDMMHNIPAPPDRSKLSERLIVAKNNLEAGEFDELDFLKFMATQNDNETEED